ncbi:MAG: class I SAM-dependent methyltransferase [Candidatus Pacebacteria bacterium]|jgi:SAM-dependent methyltransferase|nr:class I SAM-dependent methyltransferase [Candidatus Paceibacterota bacterium]
MINDIKLTDNELNKLKKDFNDSGSDIMIALDREGNEIRTLFKKDKTDSKSKKIFPVMVDKYEWGRTEHIKKAKEFRDRIEYIYTPEGDKGNPQLAKWRLDDEARIKTTKTLPYGEKVLESGCSSGTVSIEIAKNSKVKEVVGVDIRDDAIDIANNLKKKELSELDANKLTFVVSAIEDLDYKSGYFDTVCAFEIFEHLVPDDFEKAILSMIRMMNKDGNFLIAIPNRYPDEFYINENRTRWNAPDHKNFFSVTSLEFILRKYFKNVRFFSINNQSYEKGVHLIAEATGIKS